MKKRILVISWFFPPVNSSEGLVTYKLLKASKYEYDVFTQKNNASWSYGKKDELPPSDNIHPIFAKSKELADWYPEAVEYYRQNADKYDIVMTRSMPPESHMAGLEIKKAFPGVKWIASFGDPVADNPFTKLALSIESPHSRKYCRSILGVFSPKRIIRNALFKMRLRKQKKQAFKKEEILQREIMKKCDRIIFNSEYQRDYMLSAYKEDYTGKSWILNHSFDPSLYPETKSENGVLTMNYVGHLDAIRTPRLFLEALCELAEDDPDLKDKFRVNFYGNMSDADKVYVVNNELYDIVRIRKPVNYQKSLEIMKNSDWLLHVDANITQLIDKNIFFAAKLADYIGAGSKIFGITMFSGISYDIMSKLGSVCVSYSKNEIKNYLYLIIYKNYTVDTNEEFRKEFENTEVARKFDLLTEEL